jgi:hypothetical protein
MKVEMAVTAAVAERKIFGGTAVNVRGCKV